MSPRRQPVKISKLWRIGFQDAKRPTDKAINQVLPVIDPTHSDGYWRVGIQNPFLPRGNFLLVLKIKNQSVVTSGDGKLRPSQSRG